MTTRDGDGTVTVTIRRVIAERVQAERAAADTGDGGYIRTKRCVQAEEDLVDAVLEQLGGAR